MGTIAMEELGHLILSLLRPVPLPGGEGQKGPSAMPLRKGLSGIYLCILEYGLPG